MGIKQFYFGLSVCRVMTNFCMKTNDCRQRLLSKWDKNAFNFVYCEGSVFNIIAYFNVVNKNHLTL